MKIYSNINDDIEYDYDSEFEKAGNLLDMLYSKAAEFLESKGYTEDDRESEISFEGESDRPGIMYIKFECELEDAELHEIQDFLNEFLSTEIYSEDKGKDAYFQKLDDGMLEAYIEIK